MGIAGAALATTVSRGMELALTLYENTLRSQVCIRLKYIRHSSEKLKRDFWHYTAPILGNELGKGNLKQAREYGDRLFKIAVFTGAVSGIILLAVSPVGMIAAFMLKLPVMVVYFIISMDEVIKVPAVYRHYKKYKWVKNLTENNSDYGVSGSVSEG